MKTNSVTEITFTCAFVHSSDYLFIASMTDEADDSDSSKLWQFDGSSDWGYDDYDYNITDIITTNSNSTKTDQLYAISTEGNILILDDNGIQEEYIANSGVFADWAEGIGYMTGLNQIGEHLYACGGRGQVYKRLGPNQWVQMDEGIRQSIDTPFEECHHLMDISGPSEDAIYATANNGKVLFWNGVFWTSIDTPTYADLGKILVETPECIWIAGGDGTLLKGNAEVGFVNVSNKEDLLFTDIVRHEGMLYLASHLGLYTFDESKNQIKRVKTGLKPEHSDTHSLGSKDGVLWSIGDKDIVRLEGRTWSRIQHGDNPPIA